MAECDLHHNVKLETALDITAVSSETTTVGNIIDTAEYESIEFGILAGTLASNATVTWTAVLQDGDDAALSDAATIDSSLVLGTLPVMVNDGATDDSDGMTRVGTITKKRYVRLSIVSAGTTPSGTISAVAIKGHPHHAPVADQS